MNRLRITKLTRLVTHLEMAHQKPLKDILNQLFYEEGSESAVAARLGVHLAILNDLLGLCETRPLEEITHV